MKAPHLRNTADYIYLNVHELYLKHAVDFTTNTEVTLRVNKWLQKDILWQKNECIVHPRINIIYSSSNYSKPVELICSVQNKMIF